MGKGISSTVSLLVLMSIVLVAGTLGQMILSDMQAASPSHGEHHEEPAHDDHDGHCDDEHAPDDLDCAAVSHSTG